MNLTQLQKRKLVQFREEIAELEQLTQTQGVRFAIQLSWIQTMAVFIFNFSFDWLTENRTLPQYLEAYSWWEIVRGFVVWFLLDYFFLVKGNQRLLRKRRKELAAYEAKLAKETAA